MDDIQVAKTLKALQQEMLTDQEVIHFLTKLNHLELRVKNVAVMKLFKIQQNAKKSSTKDEIANLIKRTMKKAGNMNLQRTLTQNLRSDGLVERLREKIQETHRKVNNQCNAMRKIHANVELLMPIRRAGTHLHEDYI
mmetsp:Transcript_19260/g.26076  ORF Transcript_19260/g.26076 Transcript_19260/m.26076 type:complete len:138 (+) Transcript_19260:888-1301(+)